MSLLAIAQPLRHCLQRYSLLPSWCMCNIILHKTLISMLVWKWKFLCQCENRSILIFVLCFAFWRRPTSRKRWVCERDRNCVQKGKENWKNYIQMGLLVMPMIMYDIVLVDSTIGFYLVLKMRNVMTSTARVNNMFCLTFVFAPFQLLLSSLEFQYKEWLIQNCFGFLLFRE